MKSLHPALFALALLTLLATPSFAGKNTPLQPTLSKLGTVLAEDAFDAPQLAATWTHPKGDWQIVDGALVGKEKAEDKHAGVLALNKSIHDTIVAFSLKLDGAKGMDLSFNHPKGHLFRLVVSPEGFIIRTDGEKGNAEVKPVELARASAKFEPGKWVSFLVEVKGSKVAVQTDNGGMAEGTHPSLDVDKTGYRFVVRGESIGLDDFKAWTAQ